MKHFKHTLWLLPLILLFACKNEGKDKKSNEDSIKDNVKTFNIPDFNADSAYAYVEKQVSFGPRVPNTLAHKECLDYIVAKMKQFSDHVMVQEGKVKLYNGKVITAKNIITSYKPEYQNRVLLAAHWDSRPYADHDPDKANHSKPIDGANDGASGVGVLIELARLMHNQAPTIGIDIIFFDVEDYGTPQDKQTEREDTWCLGSQYWANNPHKQNYFARYGILLDMVGAKNAQFPHEYFSKQYAPDVLKKVWAKARELGYAKYFIEKDGNPITDDHLYINTIIKIPTIDIIHLDDEGETGFFEYWHTLNDNMNQIDKETLKAVGQTVTAVIYSEPY